MRKTILVFSIIVVLAVIVSGTIGYFAGYAIGTLNMYHSNAMTYSNILFLQSRTIARKVDSSGANGLIDAMEQSGDEWAAVVRNWQPISRAKDEEAYSRAIEAWEVAQKKLEELRTYSPSGN